MAHHVRAAGAVLWRPAAGGTQICLVHRPRYDDWSLPKGKLKSGEHPLLAAVREVREETGVCAVPQVRLPNVAYRLTDGTAKKVDFWLMRAADGPAAGPADTDEVDAVQWLTPSQALARVSYPDDARLLRHVATLPPVTAALPLVRHGHAGRRDAFDGDDSARPLDARGREEAAKLGPLLAVFQPQQLRSATPLRCRQTLHPLAQRVQLPVLADPAFDEPAPGEELADRVAAAAARLTELAHGDRTVICSQGKLMPSLLALLDGVGDAKAYKTPKGGGWLLAFTGNRLVDLDRL